jgi:hypothetical protein
LAKHGKARESRESTGKHGEAQEMLNFSVLDGVLRRETSQEGVILPSQGQEQQRQHNLLESCRIFKISMLMERSRRDLSIDVANLLEGQGVYHSFS